MIREAKYETDIGSIYGLINAAYKIKQREFTKENRWSYRDEICHMFVFVVQDVIVGCIKAKVEDDIVKIGPIAVAQSHQGQGIGSKLLEYAETLAAVSQLEIVSCQADLKSYYSKKGYKEFARSPMTTFYNPALLTRTDVNFVKLEKRMY